MMVKTEEYEAMTMNRERGLVVKKTREKGGTQLMRKKTEGEWRHPATERKKKNRDHRISFRLKQINKG